MKREINQTIWALGFCVILSGCGDKASPQNSQSADSNNIRTVASRNNPPENKAKTRISQTIEAKETPEPEALPPIAPVIANTIAVVTNRSSPANAIETPGEVQPPAELMDRANRGEANAQRDLGKLYTDQGKTEEANAWYAKAAAQGDAEAQRIMGLRYTFGQGVERNMEEAGKWFLLAAEQGDSIAQRELAKVYGDQWKYAESNDWYLKAALQGDAEAQRMLGLRYTIGQGLESNREEARKWFLMAAEQGDAIAQRELGKYYGEKWQLKESNEWYLKAALQGDIRAQHMMGVRYTFGQGVERNVEEAGKWFLLAAEQGDAQSQFSVGMRWALGEAGEPQDFAEAAKWFQLSAEQGLDEAQLRLGQRYAEGSGVKQDYVEAYKWWLLARDQGKVQGAGQALEGIRVKMTAEQIAQATEKAKAFIPKAGVPLKLQ